MKKLSLTQLFANSFFLLCLALPVNAYSGWFGPKDFDECIIEGMKGVQSDVAAKLVYQSCLKKFPPPKAKEPEKTTMPSEAQEKLTGRAGMGPYGYFSGNIYNGNSDWTVTELIININEKDWMNKTINYIKDNNNKPKPRMDKYKIEVVIPPYTNNDFSISVDWPRDKPNEWNIYKALGYKQRKP